ncbi:MAG TPA: nucleotide pyrophosphohydrolase [Gammaproteobacteria bacterium]|nr:nucleotide pyrophosphohydrolase [Gammaproteobacteria bacterium]
MAACDLSKIQKELLEFARLRDWEQFHAPKNLAMALSVEASELLEHFQWLNEQQSKTLNVEKKHAVSLEMADVFIYLMRMATELKVDILAAVEEKIKINNDKYPVEKVRGSSKKYNEYE